MHSDEIVPLTIKELLSEAKYLIPIYQRNYDWKQENCKQLFDDLVQVIRENKPIR